MEWRKKITHPENCWSLRNHRAAENKKMERNMETQTSESQEKRRLRAVKCVSMEGIMPNFSDDPDVKTEERFSHQNPSSCSQDHTTSLMSRASSPSEYSLFTPALFQFLQTHPITNNQNNELISLKSTTQYSTMNLW